MQFPAGSSPVPLLPVPQSMKYTASSPGGGLSQGLGSGYSAATGGGHTSSSLGGPLAHGPPSSGTGSGQNTWEWNKSRALLALEDEKAALLRRLEGYSQLDEAHRREMARIQDQHEQQMSLAQVGLCV